ncbi:MAG: hypothetical protein WDA04_00045 [Anaerolineaceae bacterium]|jgi:hypothetical protein
MSELKPLHVINVFIEPWFREEIIENVLADFSVYTTETRKELAETLKTEVKVSGFRNPLTAPKRLLVRDSEKLFESDPHFVRIILNAWMQLFQAHSETFEKVLKVLKFQITETAPTYSDPENAFNQGWPEGVDYPKVIEAIRNENENIGMTDDQIVLYSILKTGFVPGEKEEDND